MALAAGVKPHRHSSATVTIRRRIRQKTSSTVIRNMAGRAYGVTAQVSCPGVSQHLGRLAEESYERRGDYPALLFEGRWYGSGELFDRSRRLAAGLADHGVNPGDRVVVTMANCPEVGDRLSGDMAHRCGRDPGDLPASAGRPPPCRRRRRSHRRRDHARVRAQGDRGDGRPRSRQARDLHSRCRGGRDVDVGARGGRATGGHRPRSDDDLAALLYTGGTTGRSKGVMLTHANLYFTGRAAHDACHVQGVNRALDHAAAVTRLRAAGHARRDALGRAGRRRAAALVRPDAFLALIAEHRLQLSAVGADDAPDPALAAAGGVRPLVASLHELRRGAAGAGGGGGVRRRVPSVSIRQGYGLTETGALISTNPLGREQPGSVGKPVPGTRGASPATTTGTELPPGEIGEICCRSPGVMQGYWNARRRRPREAIRDGWLHTGDLGYLDDGGIPVHRRPQEGSDHSRRLQRLPRDIEDALVEHPEVQMAGVVGQARHESTARRWWRSCPASDGAQLEPEELVAWARERIGGYKYPREVHVVETLPLTPWARSTARRCARSWSPSPLRARGARSASPRALACRGGGRGAGPRGAARTRSAPA